MKPKKKPEIIICPLDLTACYKESCEGCKKTVLKFMVYLKKEWCK